MLTTDFSGTYDYEEEEANSEFDWFLERALGWDNEQQEGFVEKTQSFWKKALEPEGYIDFCKQWNKRAGENGFRLGLFMVPEA